VTVIGSVASGAEVAGGSIHVHGALRGRAMAFDGRRQRPHLLPKNEPNCSPSTAFAKPPKMDPKLRSHPVRPFSTTASCR
jgi:hypothetical protein